MLKKILDRSIFPAVLGFFLFASSALAAGLLPTPTGPGGGCKSSNCGNYSLNDMLSLGMTVANWILGVVGAVALLFFVYGGFVLILSGGSEERVKEGKQVLINAIIGLVIVFTSYLIIQFAAGLLGAKVTPGLRITIPAK